MSDLIQKKCRPCEGGVAPLTPAHIQEMLRQVPEWHADPSSTVIARTFIFKNFTEAMRFINRVAQIAEAEDHHPDIFLHNYKKVTISLSTHAIKGLSENDFIVAAKINTLV